MRKVIFLVLCFVLVGFNLKAQMIGKWNYSSVHTAILLDDEYLKSHNKIDYSNKTLANTTNAFVILSCETDKPIIKATPVVIANSNNFNNLKAGVFLDDKQFSINEINSNNKEFTDKFLKAKKMVIINNGKKSNFDLESRRKYTDEIIEKFKQDCKLN